VFVFNELTELIRQKSRPVFYKGLKQLDAEEPLRIALANDDTVTLDERYDLVAQYIQKLEALRERETDQSFKRDYEEWLSDFRKLKSELSFRLGEEHRRIVYKELVLPYRGDFIRDETKEVKTNNLIERIRQHKSVMLQVKPIEHMKITMKEPIQAKTTDKPEPNELDELIDTLEGLDAKRIADILGRSQLEYIKSIIRDIEYRARTYIVPGLFVKKINEREHGEIRNIRVTFHLGEQEDGYGLNIAKSDEGQRLINSIKNATKAASAILFPEEYSALSHYSIRIGIENPSTFTTEYEGGSLGVAVATAIIAEATGQEIGIKRLSDVAITGEVISENGDVGSVKGVKDKARAVKDWNDRCAETESINHILVPTINQSEVPAEFGLAVHPISKINDLFQILFDPWHEYLNLWQPFPEDSSNEEILDSETPKTVVFKEFYRKSAAIADDIARQFAKARMEAAEETKLKAQKHLVPVILNIGGFRKETMLSEVITDVVNQRLKRAEVKSMDRVFVEKELTAGRFALILDSLDSYDDIDFLKSGGAMQTEVERSLNKWLFICNESTWQRRDSEIRDSEEYQIIKLYDGHSTFLDEYISQFFDKEEGEARDYLLPYKIDKIPPIEFFEKKGGTAYYLEQWVREVDWNNQQIGEIQQLFELIRSGQAKRILLLGDGGSGKTTALLKLFFDCQQQRIVTDVGQAFVPLFLKATNLAEAGALENAVEKNGVNVKEELKYTKNLLIMIDGLNEINPETAKRFPQIVDDIHRDYKDHIVVLTSRKQEMLRQTSILRKDAIVLNFKVYELLDMDSAVYKRSLQEAIGAELATQILENLKGHYNENLAANPMMLYFISIIPDKLKQQLDAGGAVNKGKILESVNKELMKREWNSDLNTEDRLESDVAFELLKLIARRMTMKQTANLTKDEVIDIIKEIYQLKPLPTWYPKDYPYEKNGIIIRPPLPPKKVFEMLITWPMLRVSKK